MRHILHADIRPGEAEFTRSRDVLSTRVLKLALLAIATHERERITIAQIAAMSGIQRKTANCAVLLLLERGLITRHDAAASAPSLPTSGHGPANRYTIQHARISALPRINLDTRRTRTKRKEAAA